MASSDDSLSLEWFVEEFDTSRFTTRVGGVPLPDIAALVTAAIAATILLFNEFVIGTVLTLFEGAAGVLDLLLAIPRELLAGGIGVQESALGEAWANVAATFPIAGIFDFIIAVLIIGAFLQVMAWGIRQVVAVGRGDRR